MWLNFLLQREFAGIRNNSVISLTALYPLYKDGTCIVLYCTFHFSCTKWWQVLSLYRNLSLMAETNYLTFFIFSKAPYETSENPSLWLRAKLLREKMYNLKSSKYPVGWKTMQHHDVTTWYYIAKFITCWIYSVHARNPTWVICEISSLGCRAIYLIHIYLFTQHLWLANSVSRTRWKRIQPANYKTLLLLSAVTIPYFDVFSHSYTQPYFRNIWITKEDDDEEEERKKSGESPLGRAVAAADVLHRRFSQLKWVPHGGKSWPSPTLYTTGFSLSRYTVEDGPVSYCSLLLSFKKRKIWFKFFYTLKVKKKEKQYQLYFNCYFHSHLVWVARSSFILVVMYV